MDETMKCIADFVNADTEDYLRQVGGFLWVLQFPPPIKLNATI
jgi:hypothetical protein